MKEPAQQGCISGQPTDFACEWPMVKMKILDLEANYHIKTYQTDKWRVSSFRHKCSPFMTFL